MARNIYIGVPVTKTVTNLIGQIGDFEDGTWKVVDSEKHCVLSSTHKFGAKSLVMRQAEAATELLYTLKNNGQILVQLDNTHTYYASIWVNTQSLETSCDIYWPIAEPSVMSGAKNTKINEWQQHSVVFKRNMFTNGQYPVRIDANNYPGNNIRVYFDGLMIVDLTATFGAGNEPDKAWCDQNIAFTTSTTTVNWSVSRKVSNLYLGVGDKARKVIKGYIGVNGVARQFFGEFVEAGTYWLINADGTKEYNANGTLVKSSSTKTSWTCPSAGTYSIELHATGGRGGNGEGDNDFTMVFDNPQWSAAAAGGGGGGGSGCIIQNISLSQKSYKISIDESNETRFHIDENISYYVRNGSSGENGNADSFGVPSADGGQGGSVGATNATNIARTGTSGDQDAIMGAYASASGGDGGSGGSTIGSYGDGGAGGSASQNGGNSGQYGKPGAIIIRKL